MAKSKIGRARQLAKRALRRANQRGDEAGMAAAKAKLRTLHEQTQKARVAQERGRQAGLRGAALQRAKYDKFALARMKRAHAESEQLAERMARDRDE